MVGQVRTGEEIRGQERRVEDMWTEIYRGGQGGKRRTGMGMLPQGRTGFEDNRQ